jgi:hypothetical protein
LTVVLAACNNNPEPDEIEMAENTTSTAFDDVVEGSYMDYDCSPDIDDPDFRGIVLNAPEVVYFSPGESNPISGAFAQVIVCGAFAFDYDTMGLEGDFADSIVVVAVDEASRASFHGTMLGIENQEPEPAGIYGEVTPADLSDDVIGGYFNPNLAVILGLPEKEADYVVYALLGPFESNRVRMSIRESQE